MPQHRPRWRHLSRFTIHVSLALLLSACGFALRGAYQIPPPLQNLRVDAPASSGLKPELELALQTAGVNTREGGELKLSIEHERLNRQTSTVDSRAKVSEYTLVYDLQYRLRYSENNRPATAPRTLLLRRSYQYDSTSIVGKNTEEETLTQELHRDAAQQIVRQLSALPYEQLQPGSDNPTAESPGAEAPAQP